MQLIDRDKFNIKHIVNIDLLEMVKGLDLFDKIIDDRNNCIEKLVNYEKKYYIGKLIGCDVEILIKQDFTPKKPLKET